MIKYLVHSKWGGLPGGPIALVWACIRNNIFLAFHPIGFFFVSKS